MTQQLVTALLLISSSALLFAETKADFYISPDGSDVNPGSIDRPFKTLTKARDAVRKLKQTVKNRDILVYLRGGQYRLKKTVVFDLRDSGNANQTITYSSYPGETAELNGSIPIDNWKKIDKTSELPPRIRHLKDNIWVYTNPGLRSGKWKPYNIFQGGKSLPRSRQGFAFDNPYYKTPHKSKAAPRFRKLTPKEIQNKDYYSKSREELVTKGVKGDGKGRFEVNELCGYLFYSKDSIRKWDNLHDIELFLFTRAEWLHEMRGIRSIDTENRRAFFDFPTKFSTEMRKWRMTHPDKYPHEYYVENAIDYMDEEGEWCVNSNTGTIYIVSKNKPSAIEAAQLTEFILVQGKVEGIGENNYRPSFTDVPVTHLAFKNLHFTKGNGYRETRKDQYIHVAYDVYDAPSSMFRLRGTEHCFIDSCHFSNAGGGGIRIDLHAQHNMVKNNHIHHLGRAGITLIGYTPGTKNVSKHNTVYNNHIHHIGQIRLSSLGIGIVQSGHNHVAHNTVHHFPFMGIATLGHWTFKINLALKGQLWGAEEGFERPGNSAILRKDELKKRGVGLYDYLHSKKNLIEHNELYEGCYALGDVNPMYINTCSGENLIRRNYAHDCLSHTHIGTGFRTDDGSRDNIMEENITYNCAAGIAIKNKGNRYTNNFLIATRPEAVRRHGLIKFFLTNPEAIFNNRIHRNIAYTTVAPLRKKSSQPLLTRWFPLVAVRLKDGKVSHKTLELMSRLQNPAAMDHNILYAPGKPPGQIPNLMGAHSEFKNPRFRNVANHDFFIQNKAIIQTHAIKQIDASTIGLTQEFPAHYRGYHTQKGAQKVRLSRSQSLSSPHSP